jgi:hypothetical protein
MTELNVLTGGTLNWQISDGAQAAYPLRAYPGWSLRNPLYSAPDDQFVSPRIIGRVDSSTLVTTSGICFSAESATGFPAADPAGHSIVTEVLQRLRYISRQFTLPVSVAASGRHETSEDAKKLEAPSRAGTEIRLRSYHLPTAITERHIETVAGLAADFSVPVHADVLLDALEAHVEGDFRKALLYGAIAVESFAAGQLEEAAKAAIARAEAQHRVITVAVNAQTTVQKDPISSLLLEGENFSRLLHQAPLYILGRSLLVEREDTYQKAVRLYGTRNKIAHLGSQPVEAKYFPATFEGAREALDAVVAAIDWFGDPGPYIVWDRQFASLRVA